MATEQIVTRQFRATTGAVFSNEDAQVIGARILEIGEQSDTPFHGVMPDMIVKDAARESSPLHPFFEWDDRIAAHEFRCHQARYYIRNLRVVVVDPHTEEESTTKAFHSAVVERTKLTDDDGDEDGGEGRSYVFTKIVMETPDLREQVLRNALREIKSWQTRYQEYKELARVFDAIDETARQLKLMN